MAKANLTFQFPSVTDDLIVTWQEHSAPNVEIDREVYSAPHAQRELVVEDLNPVVHEFRFYSSVDGTTLSSLLVTMSIDCSIYNENAVEIYEFTVGDGLDVGDGVHTSPENDSVDYYNDLLATDRVDKYTVEKPGYGPLSWTRPDIITKSAGGFSFANDDKFQDDETYYITAYLQVAAQVGSSNPAATSADFAGTLNVSADTTFSSDYYNYLLYATGSTAVITVSIDLSAMANGKYFYLNTHQFTGNNVTIRFGALQTVYLLGTARNAIHLGVGEEIKIYFDGGVGYVTITPEGYKHLGSRRMGNAALVNELALDGSEYTVANYPRAKEFMDSLSVDQVVDYTTWEDTTVVEIGGVQQTVYPNKGLFALSADGTMFKVPDDRDRFYRVKKYFDATSDGNRITQAPGGLQTQDFLAEAGLVSGPRMKRNTYDSNSDFFMLKKDNFTDPNSDATYATAPTSSASGGSEVRPDNLGLIAFIKI